MAVGKRWEALDELRGLAILCLFIFNTFFPFKNTPWWLTHNPGTGIWPADIVAPIFLFSVGISGMLSFQKRVQTEGNFKATTHYLKRSLMLILFGMLGEIFYFQKIFLQLGVLGSIGVSSIIALPMIMLPWKMRPAYAGLLLVLWQMMQWIGYGADLNSNGLGGIYACIAWTALIVIASFIAGIPDRNKLTGLILFTTSGIILFRYLTFPHIPISRPLVSTSFIAVSAEIVLMLLLLFHLKEQKEWRWNLLSLLGKNPLPLYMISGLIGFSSGALFGPELSLKYIIPIALLQIGASIQIAFFLEKKQWYWRL